MLFANFNRKEHLRHRAVSLRQHGFLVVLSAHAEKSVDFVVSTSNVLYELKSATLLLM